MGRAAVQVSVTAILYWLAGRLALLMAIPPGYATAVWPAAGLGLICVLVWGKRVAPGIALGSFLINIGTTLDTAGAAVAVAVVIGVGAALQASLGAALVRRHVGFPTPLEEPRDIVWFIALGGPIACLVSCTVGVTTLAIAGVIDVGSIAISWFTWWAGDTIGVLVFAPLAMLVVRGSPPIWRRRRLVVGLPLLVGFAVVTILFVRASASERHRLQADFERRASAVAAVLRLEVSKYEEVVSGVARYVEASERVTRAGFAAFCRQALAAHPGLLALTWNPRVLRTERADFEARARADGLAGFHFLELGGDGELREAGARDEYIPIYFVEPASANRGALGFDIATDPVRSEVLERAHSRLAATSLVGLLQDRPADREAAVLLVAPVGSAARTPRGYGVAVFRVRHMVDAALAAIDHDGLTFSLVDESAPTAIVLYGPTSDPGATRYTIGFGDRSWRFEVAPTAASLRARRSWQPWMVLSGGLFFLGLLGVVLLVTTGRTASIDEGAARFRALVEASAQIVWTTNARGEVVEDSPSWRRFTGQTFEQWLGWGRLEAIHPDDRDRVRASWQEAVRGGAQFETEYRIRFGTGAWRWTLARAVPLFDERGALRGWVNLNTDITDRQRVADQFRVAIEAAPTGVLMVDRDGKIVLVNAELERLFGYRRDALIGRPMEVLVPERFRANHPGARTGFHAKPEARAMGRGAALYGLRADGTEVPVEIGLNPLSIGDDRFVLAAVVDVTERERAGTEREDLLRQLRTLNVDLEERVAARTSELTQALREREVMLQEIHHRVKNNLQVISSLISMQVRKLDDGSSRGALEECQTRVQAIALIHEKLYQSRDYANVPFSDYARALATTVFHTAGVSRDKVTLEMTIEDIAVPVDKAIPCGLILNELITNALKHAFVDGRRGEVHVELVRSGGRVRLVVSDDGIGLPADFDLQRSQSLGLELVITLVEQLDASLEVSGDAGARFAVSFELENRC